MTVGKRGRWATVFESHLGCATAGQRRVCNWHCVTLHRSALARSNSVLKFNALSTNQHYRTWRGYSSHSLASFAGWKSTLLS